MRYNQNAGWGQSAMASLPFAGSGKIFIVGDSGTVNLAVLKEIFLPDADGKVRFYSTIDAAVGACTADAGDVILVMPGHTETVTSAGLLDLDVAGITILGLGNGAARPLINLTTVTTADVDVDAANIRIVNVIFDLTGVDAVVAGIDVNASDLTLERCKIIMGDSDGQAVVGLLSDTGIDRVSVIDCEFQGDTIAGPAAAVRIIGGVEHVIHRSRFAGNYSQAPIALVTTAPLRISIRSNEIENFNAASSICIQGVAAMTGIIAYNAMSHPTAGQGGWITTPGSCRLIENYGANDCGAAGILDIGNGLSTT